MKLTTQRIIGLVSVMKRKYQAAFKAAANASPEVRALGYQRWVRILRTWIEVTDNANSNTNNRRILD